MQYDRKSSVSMLQKVVDALLDEAQTHLREFAYALTSEQETQCIREAKRCITEAKELMGTIASMLDAEEKKIAA